MLPEWCPYCGERIVGKGFICAECERLQSLEHGVDPDPDDDDDEDGDNNGLDTTDVV